MKIEGGTVDIHFLHKFPDGDFFDAFLLHQPGQTHAQLRAGLSHTAVYFL